jgi:3-phenylpropionate/cinnamic acid dioxygenase small subunit
VTQPPSRLSPEEIADRLEIERLLVAYGWALDSKDWDALRACFAPGATVDYTTSGGPAGTADDFVPWVAKMLSAFPMTQHMMTNIDVTIDGDTAIARTACYNPMGAATDEGPLHHFFIGLEYHDRLVRTDAGWKIAFRDEQQKWFEGSLPRKLVFPEA